jgi:hypothetical protein
MSYFYSVNRDNPLGYFPIDSDYKYYDLNLNYNPYGGGYGVNRLISPVPGDPHDSTYGNLYSSFSNYASINTLKVIDQTAKNNTPYLTGLSYFSPIVMGNQTSVKLGASSSIEIKNVYDVFVPSSNPHTWAAEFWLSLDWQDGQGLDFTTYDSFATNNYRSDIGFRSSINSYPKILLISIGYYTSLSGTQYFNNYASVFYNQQTNSIEFYVPQADGSYDKAYSVVSDIDSPMHIYVTYSNKTINVSINGKSGISAYVGNGLYQDANILNNYYNMIFRFSGGFTYVDPSTNTLRTQQLQNNQYVLLSNLTFYDYILTERQLANHIKWAFYDNKPVKDSIQYGNHIFDLEENTSNFAYSKNFSNKDFNDYSDIYNLNISSTGLQPQKINRISFNNLDKTSVLSVPSDGSGADWIGGKAGLDFNDFGKLSSNPCTISLVVEPSVSHPDEYIFAISNVNGSSTLFIDRSSNTYNLKYYDVLNGGTITTIGSVTPNYTKPYHKIAVSLTNNSAILTVISAVSESSVSLSDITTQSSPYSQTFVFASNSILTVGQSYHNGNDLSNLLANSSIFSYLGISDVYVSDFTNKYINGYYYSNGYPWNGIIKYSCPLQYYYDLYNSVASTQSFPVYQMGYWITTLPLSALDSIAGSKVDWNSTNNCLVEYSFNDPTVAHQEQNWYALSRNGGPITGFNFSNKLANMRIRVTMITKYDVQDTNQSFNNLSIGFYRNMNFYSDGESFLLTPGSRSANGTSFTIKNHSKPIQARPNNLGLLFAYSSSDSSIPGYAKIKNVYNKNIAGLDFWFRGDTNYQSKKILVGDSTIAGYPDLYTDSNGRFGWNSNIKSVYINGYTIENAASAAAASEVTGVYSVNPYNPLHISVILNRTDLITNPSFETNNTGWSSAQTSGVVRNSTYQYSGTYSGRVTMSSTTDSNIAYTPATLASGTYTISAYFYIPAGSTIAGRTVSLTAETSGATTSNSTSATLTVGSWTRASARVTVTGATSAKNLVARLSNTPNVNLSTASGNGTIITYTTQGAAAHGLTTGDIVTITGFTPTGYNQTSKSVTVLNTTQFTIAGSTTGTSSGTGLCAPALNLANASGQIIYTDAWMIEAGTVLGVYIDSEAPYAGDIYLNGTSTDIGPEASYGFINIWETRMTQKDALDRFSLFVYNSTSIASNDNYMDTTSIPVNFDMQKDMPIPHKIGT